MDKEEVVPRTRMSLSEIMTILIMYHLADRGYISQKLFEKLLKKDITLVTRAKKNMKNICDTGHSRHRSVTNFLVNLVSALAAYSFLPKKPSVCSASNMQEGI